MKNQRARTMSWRTRILLIGLLIGLTVMTGSAIWAPPAVLATTFDHVVTATAPTMTPTVISSTATLVPTSPVLCFEEQTKATTPTAEASHWLCVPVAALPDGAMNGQSAGMACFSFSSSQSETTTPTTDNTVCVRVYVEAASSPTSTPIPTATVTGASSPTGTVTTTPEASPTKELTSTPTMRPSHRKTPQATATGS